jgi:hypothetical protein
MLTGFSEPVPMAAHVDGVPARALTHQLVVLPAKGEPGAAVTCALDQARDGGAVGVRDAAVLTVRPPEVSVTEPADDWPGRQRLGIQWWTALSEALRDVGACGGGHGHAESCFRHLVEAGVSRSFLEEAAMALAASSTTVLLLADRIDVPSLLPRLERGDFTRLIYGWLPDAAVDELASVTGLLRSGA